MCCDMAVALVSAAALLHTGPLWLMPTSASLATFFAWGLAIALHLQIPVAIWIELRLALQVRQQITWSHGLAQWQNICDDSFDD